MNKFGPHFQRFTKEIENLLAAWQPPLAVWVDPEPSGVARIRQASPRTFLVGRKNEHNQGTWDSPNLKDRACYWADRCAEMGRCDAYYGWNEPAGQQDLARLNRFDDYLMWFRERLLGTHGMEAVGPSMATGNLTKDGDPTVVEAFPKWTQAARHIDVHEYDWIIDPDLRPADLGRLGYYWLRWPHWLQAIGRDDVTLWVTECGMTQAVHQGRPDEGWRSGADGMDDGDYLAWARWYNAQLVQDERVGGAALFNFAGWGWGTFEHLGWERLGEILAISAEPPPEQPEPEPPGGDKVKVFNMAGEEVIGAEADDILAKHGVSFDMPPGLRSGDPYYAVTAAREKTGHHSFIYRVLDCYGNPVVNPDEVLDLTRTHRAWWWPDVEEQNDIEIPYPTDWYRYADLGGMGESGEGGSGMGAWHRPYEVGPYEAWVRHPTIRSMKVKGIGMLDLTPHDHVDVEWQEKVYGGTEPSPGGEKVLKIISRIVIEPWGSAEMVLCYPKDMAMDTAGQARIKDVPASVYDPDLEPPFGAGEYAAVKNCCDFEGTEPREYQLMVTRIGSAEPITPIAKETFGPRPDFRQVIFTVDYVEEEPGPEPPAPPAGDDRERLLQIADGMEADAAEVRQIAQRWTSIPGELEATFGVQKVKYTRTAASASIAARIAAPIKAVLRRLG